MHIFYYKNYEFENVLELKKIGIKNYQIEFFDEDSKVTTDIIKKYKSILLDK